MIRAGIKIMRRQILPKSPGLIKTGVRSSLGPSRRLTVCRPTQRTETRATEAVLTLPPIRRAPLGISPLSQAIIAPS